MFNMFSAISISDDKAPRRGFPWRFLAILLLLAALTITSWRIYQHAKLVSLAQLSTKKLVVATNLSEKIEDEISTGNPPNFSTLEQEVTPLFAAEPTLGAVRLWSPLQQLTCEISRLAPQTPHGEDDALLPNLRAHSDMLALRERVADTDWVDIIAQIQLLQDEQGDISDALSNPGVTDKQKMLRVQLYDKQNDMLHAMQTLDNPPHSLGDTQRDMNKVLDALTQDEQAVPTSLAASHQVEDDLSAALGQYRSSVSAAPGLPKEFAALAPPPQSRIERLLPFVSGQRVLVPIFIADVNDQLTSAGFVEEIFYIRPADALNSLTATQYALPALLLVLIILLLCWPRRRHREYSD
jgi:hypothetical protein